MTLHLETLPELALHDRAAFAVRVRRAVQRSPFARRRSSAVVVLGFDGATDVRHRASYCAEMRANDLRAHAYDVASRSPKAGEVVCVLQSEGFDLAVLAINPEAELEALGRIFRQRNAASAAERRTGQ